jgi:oligopeptide/dipeptide ABC transporter ATP-binding protein
MTNRWRRAGRPRQRGGDGEALDRSSRRHPRCSRWMICACISRSGAASCSAPSARSGRRRRLAGTGAWPHAGAGRRVGLRQDDGRQGDPATAAGQWRQRALAGRGTRRLQSRRELRPLRRHMQMIFQDPFASLNPRLSVGEIIAEGMRALASAGTGRRAGGRRTAAIAAVLQQVGLAGRSRRALPARVLGRAAAAYRDCPRAGRTAGPGDLRRADLGARRFGAGADSQSAGDLQAELGLAYLFITHNFAVVDHLAHEVAVMYLGRIVEQGTVDEVLRSPQHPYTRALLSAVPSPRLDAQPSSSACRREIPSPAASTGRLPFPSALPAGQSPWARRGAVNPNPSTRSRTSSKSSALSLHRPCGFSSVGWGHLTISLSRVAATRFMSFQLAPSIAMANGTPLALVSKRRLTPLLLRSVGLGPRLFPTQRGLGHRAIPGQPIPVDPLEPIVFRQRLTPEGFEDPGIPPLRKTPVRRTA